MGAPIGNQNAKKDNRIVGDELRKAIAQDDRRRVRMAIEKLLDKASEGDLQAFKELTDRVDGKAAQSIELAGENGGPLAVSVIERRIIGPNAGS